LIVLGAVNGQTQPMSYYAGYYSNGQDIIKLKENGVGVFYMDYISSETVSIKWSINGNKISQDPTDEQQKYYVFPQYFDFSILNGRKTLSHRTMAGTFIYELK
jgi:hypothetical protein